MLIKVCKNSIGKNIIFFLGTFRFEGKIKSCDGEYLEYFDIHKNKIAYKKLSEISEFEVTE